MCIRRSASVGPDYSPAGATGRWRRTSRGIPGSDQFQHQDAGVRGQAGGFEQPLDRRPGLSLEVEEMPIEEFATMPDETRKYLARRYRDGVE